MGMDVDEPVWQIWRWKGEHYVALFGTGAVLAGMGPLSLEQARAVVAGDLPPVWSDDLGDDLTFGQERGEVEIVA